MVVRAREALGMEALAKCIAARDFPQAVVLWPKVLRSAPSPAYLQIFTDRVAALADTPARRSHWRSALQAAQRQLGDGSPLAGVIAEALRRVDQQTADRS
jgi:hypothetical protein